MFRLCLEVHERAHVGETVAGCDSARKGGGEETAPCLCEHSFIGWPGFRI